MKAVRSVLLVHNEPDAFRGLEAMLHEQEIRTCHVRQCAEIRDMLREADPVDLVMTGVTVADGTWKDVIRVVRKAAKDTPVVVMSQVVNMKLYLDTLDGGAADFIVPPMAPRDLACVLTGAMHRTVPRGITRASARPRRQQRSQPPVS